MHGHQVLLPADVKTASKCIHHGEKKTPAKTCCRFHAIIVMVKRQVTVCLKSLSKSDTVLPKFNEAAILAPIGSFGCLE